MSGVPDYQRFAERFLDLSSNQRDSDGGPSMFDSAAMPGLYDIQAGPGHIKCYMKVGKTHVNFMGNLHGGCTGSLVDLVGSAALATLGTTPHVSISITTNYLRPAPIGTIIRIESSVIKPGASVNTMIVHIYDDASNKMVAQGTHIKMMMHKQQMPGEYSAPKNEDTQTSRL
ncbi:hypothetical protein ACKKBG_A28215 [Auxenochlorella protothecoides x Auxenochlorella symbiontica]